MSSEIGIPQAVAAGSGDGLCRNFTSDISSRQYSQVDVLPLLTIGRLDSTLDALYQLQKSISHRQSAIYNLRKAAASTSRLEKRGPEGKQATFNSSDGQWLKRLIVTRWYRKFLDSVGVKDGFAATLTAFIRKWSHVVWMPVSLAIMSAPIALTVLLNRVMPRAHTIILTACWGAVELVFFILRLRHIRAVSSSIVPLPSPDIARAHVLADRVHDLSEYLDMRENVRGWFLGTPPEALSYDQVCRFVAASFFHREPSTLNSSQRAFVEDRALRLSHSIGVVFYNQPDSLQSCTHASAATSGAESTSATVMTMLAATDVDQVDTCGAASASGGMVTESVAEGAADASSVSPSPSPSPGATAAAAAVGGLGRHTVTSSASSLVTTAAAPSIPSAASPRPAMKADAKFMWHTTEPLRVFVHPLALYAGGSFIGLLTRVAMKAMGFTKSMTEGGLHYWYRDPLVAQDGPHDGKAVVFIHGLGLGLAPYLTFLSLLRQTFHDKPFVVVELPHVAIQLSFKSPAVEHLACELRSVLEEKRLFKAGIIAHSYGSFTASRYIQEHLSDVWFVGLLDPASMLACLPYSLYNSIYKNPGGNSSWKEFFLEVFRWALVSREFQASRAMCRGFNWQSLMLWAQDLPPASLVLLGGKDEVVPSPGIKRHLDRHGVESHYYDELHHGEWLFRLDIQHAFVARLVELSQR